MTDNKEKVLDQDAELDLEEIGDKIVGGALEKGHVVLENGHKVPEKGHVEAHGFINGFIN